MEFLYKPDRFRTHRIVVEGVTFHVNGHYFAEISAFFASAFFGNFKETDHKEIHLKEEALEDFEIFLEVVLPQFEGTISAENFTLLAHYSDMWDVSLLRQKCRNFLDHDIQYIPLTLEVAVDLLETALVYGFQRNTQNLIACIASFTSDMLQEVRFTERITDSLILEIVSAAMRKPSDRLRGTHRFSNQITCKKIEERESSSTCSLHGCSSSFFSECRNCHLRFCEEHEDSVKCLQPEKFYTNTVSSTQTRNQVKIVPYRSNYVDIDFERLLCQ